MSLHFGPNASDNVSVAASASIDDMAALTVLTWIRFTANPSSRRMVSKDAVPGGWSFNLATTSRPRFNVGRATTNAVALGSLPLTLNSWYFLAATYDGTDGPRIFSALQPLGTHATVTEVAYTTRTVGSGAEVHPAAGTALTVANFPALDNPISADIGRIAIFERRMSLAEIRRQQWRLIIDSDCRLYHEYWYPSGVADWSGNLNTGVITGATNASHPPITSIFGHKAGSRGALFGTATGMMVPMHYWGSI